MATGHTPGPWKLNDYGTVVCPDGFAYRDHPSRSLAEIHDNLVLIALAPTAPHECDDPKCPGNVNRLKLKAFEELKAALKKVDWTYVEVGRSMIRKALAKAEKLE